MIAAIWILKVDRVKARSADAEIGPDDHKDRCVWYEAAQTLSGGGQAGLATGYHLARLGRSFVILEADRRIGDVWRKRWDSLHLLTPARHDGLPGWKFPAKGWSFPGRDDMADYLEAYAARFGLPVRTGMPVDGVTGNGDAAAAGAAGPAGPVPPDADGEDADGQEDAGADGLAGHPP